MKDTVQSLRKKLQQLKAEHERGQLGHDAYGQRKTALEQQLLELVMASPDAAAGNAPTPTTALSTPRPARSLVALLSVAVLALAVGGYAWRGSPHLPSAGAPGSAPASAQAPEPGQAEQEAQFTAAVEKLAQRLKDQPDNAEGWAMLARSYARLGRHAQAVPAYEKAVSLSPNDARLLADFADTVAVQNQLSLDGRPTQLIEQALKLDPDNPKALALAGTAAFNRKDYKSAVRHWERLQGLTPADAAFLPQLQSSIAEARGLGGMPAAVTAGVAALPASAPTASTAPAAVVATSAVAVTGRVTLSPAVAALAAPTDTVFIFARPGTGTGMPLAVLRKQVKDLPLEYTLDDSLAMAPAARLSLFPQVIISARISKSGQAAPSAGDLQGRSDSVSHNARGVAVEINEVVKN